MPTVNEMLDTVIKHEGGYQDDKEDKGNYYKGQNLGTNWGITPSVLAEHRGKDVDRDDMYFLEEKEAREIYRKRYVAPVMRMNPPKEAIPQLVDMAINHGPRNAVKMLQRTVGATDDGAYGPGTAKAIKDYQGDLNNDLVQQRRQFYESIMKNRPEMERYRNGWLRRADSFATPAGPRRVN